MKPDVSVLQVTLMVLERDVRQILLILACFKPQLCPLISEVFNHLFLVKFSLGQSGRRSLSSVSTDSHADSDHNGSNSPLRKRLDSNESITSNNSHNSSPRAVTSNRIQPFEEIHTNFGSSLYQYREVSYQLPKGWVDMNKCYD